MLSSTKPISAENFFRVGMVSELWSAAEQIALEVWMRNAAGHQVKRDDDNRGGENKADAYLEGKLSKGYSGGFLGVHGWHRYLFVFGFKLTGAARIIVRRQEQTRTISLRQGCPQDIGRHPIG